MPVGLIGQIRQFWAPRGVSVAPNLDLEWQWAHLNLAFDGFQGQSYWGSTANMKAESILKVVERCEPQPVDVIIWDRAPGHPGKTLKRVAVLGIEQPPYSPGLKPARRLLEEVKGKAGGRAHEDIERKKTAVEEESCQLLVAPEEGEAIRWLVMGTAICE